MRKWTKRVTSDIARYAAREFADELRAIGSNKRAEPVPTNQPPSTVKIDIPDLLKQLGSTEARVQFHHLFAWNHRWIALLTERNRRTASDTYDFIEKEMPDARFDINQYNILREYREEIDKLDGQILDLGVYQGVSTRALARIFPQNTIHGFDSFEGLPESWGHQGRGAFGEVDGMLPAMPDNVELHKGWFDDTLPVWLQNHGDTIISLLRVDCDLYSSTKTCLDVLKPLIRSGTWIVFDELIGYRGWEYHEYKAFMEFIEDTGFEFEYVAYGLTYTIVHLN